MTKRISRPDCIRKLKEKWSKQYSKEHFLKSISITGDAHLRGIKNSKLCLEFPVSVLCGPNGAGKTTFMALSTLGFHAEKPPLVPLKNVQYFDFNYFFRPTATDKHMINITVSWEYTNGNIDHIVKGEQRWLRYIKNNGDPRRPIRGTEFIGISRIIPAFEKKNYHSYFSKKKYYKENSHDKELSKILSWIMSKSYSSVSELNYTNSAGSHSVNTYNGTHTSFNAGAGEECLTQIISTLLRCPEGSFIAVEEIEIGLHPSTLPKLIDVILFIAMQRKLQIIITSHSTEFLRAFPTEGLILVERVGEKIEFTNSPNAEYAIKRIGGEHKPAACIVCEDRVAGKIISMSLPAKIRTICPVVGFGGKDQLIDKALTIKEISNNTSVVIVWDGEVTDTYIKKAEENGFFACTLPGKLEPENYLISKLLTTEGEIFLSHNYNLSFAEVTTIFDDLKSISDPHDLFYILSNGVGLDGNEESLLDAVVAFVCSSNQVELESLICCISKAVAD